MRYIVINFLFSAACAAAIVAGLLHWFGALFV